MHPEVTDQQLRDAGFTPAARNYPLSPEAVVWLRKFNGLPEHVPMPAAWHFAPNAYMQKYLHERSVAESV